MKLTQAGPAMAFCIPVDTPTHCARPGAIEGAVSSSLLVEEWR